MSRLFRNPKNLPEQYRNTPELTQPPRLYSTHGKQDAPPTNGWLGSTTCHIPLHTSMQSIPWPPSYSLTTSTSILDLLRASLIHRLQGWPASMCLRPNDLGPFRHAQGCPDSSKCNLIHQVHPDHLQKPFGSLQILLGPFGAVLEPHV